MKSMICSLCVICFFVQLAISAKVEDSHYLPSRFNNDSLRLSPQMEKRKRRKQHRIVGSRYLTRRKGRRHLDKSALLNLLGEDYKPSLMNTDKPRTVFISVPAHEVNLDFVTYSKDELVKQMSGMNLTEELVSFDPDLLPFEDKIRKWMLERSSCPVHFSWKDLGKQFWPRWIREGACIDRGGYCSFPPGMNCVPSTSTTVQLLNWQCRYEERVFKRRIRSIVNDSDRETSVLYKKPVPPIPTKKSRKRKHKRKCDWIKVPYAITIDCFCAC